MRTVFIVVMAGLVFNGCAKVQHLDQLLMLKGLAEEQTQLNRYVQEQDRNFEKMVAEAKAGTLDQYSNKRKIQRTFGDPVYKRTEVKDEPSLESWLYRYATEYFGAEKIYLYFDPDGNLVKSAYIGGEDGKSKQETAPENGYQEF